MPNKATNIKDFEKSLDELESIVNKMESGELALDESLKTFEKGIKIAHSCQSALDQANQKVEMLIEENGLQQTIPFDSQK
ncbi:MAG: exodeoxyribonuclease VII small subunit [Gammaproteobacteria bacterium]|nr:exodeoxyribonuclease VII small subunit [Gammaproteobacteria bacterium]